MWELVSGGAGWGALFTDVSYIHSIREKTGEVKSSKEHWSSLEGFNFKRENSEHPRIEQFLPIPI